MDTVKHHAPELWCIITNHPLVMARMILVLHAFTSVEDVMWSFVGGDEPPRNWPSSDIFINWAYETIARYRDACNE